MRSKFWYHRLSDTCSFGKDRILNLSFDLEIQIVKYVYTVFKRHSVSTASDTIQNNPIRQTTSFPSKAGPLKKSFIPNLRISVCLSFRLVPKYCQYDAGARSRTLFVQKGTGGGRWEGRRTKKNRAVPDKQGIFREESKSTHSMKWVQNFSVAKRLNTKKSENVGCINKERSPSPPRFLHVQNL